ncbi:hypothetical protein B0A50_00229 [Salinomyces thailandicus]|uniref:Phosphoglycerate mutase family protein n=1 Tax=Salinomyces thailandicus TaxID=706561 RepID=A0A4V5N6A7_9PEZI|nr:hypothetical protein B0A50_00229 [Salinomyces thailandica]
MAQQPAVVIIARHGPRLDAADQSWHLHTPTPYDPPLTYGGWNQSRALGVRIGSLLHAREQAVNESSTAATEDEGVIAHDFATPRDGATGRPLGQGSRKRKRKQKVVIHTSPFLRCLQTSVAISAGMAQYQPPELANSRPSSSSKSRAHGPLHSVSPYPRQNDGLAELKNDFAHSIARRTLGHSKRHRKSKLRVDAFLGEWLNPQYFDHITPPPPSAMMVATAKAELMHNEKVDIFTPSLPATPVNHSLWGGGGGGGGGPRQNGHNRESSVDDLSEMQDVTSHPPPSPRRDRTSSFSSVGSNESNSGRRSQSRPTLQPRPSTLRKPETAVYVPPKPQYAVSSSDYIPRGYVSHAKQACANADFHWDSSRRPQDWGDGGQLGEEWSAMHKRFRRGFNHLIQWYSQHNADDRAEDSLSFDQAERHEDEEDEDLVVVLVTHGAGSNALIGALTGQPVLLDVGMASLTMAVRRDDAPPITTYASSTAPSADGTPRSSPSLEKQEVNGDHARRGSLDLGLSSVYEMKLISSSEHLRPSVDPSKTNLTRASNPKAGPAAPFREPLTNTALGEPGAATGNGTRANSSLGSIRRPSVTNSAMHPSVARHATSPAVTQLNDLPEDAPISPGLWTPPAAGTPRLASAKAAEALKMPELTKLEDEKERKSSTGSDLAGTDPKDDRDPAKRATNPTSAPAPLPEVPVSQAKRSIGLAINGRLDDTTDTAITSRTPSQSPTRTEEHFPHRSSITDLPNVEAKPPEVLGRTLSQKGLWGSKPAGDRVRRDWKEPKRRWTVTQKDGGR